MRPAMNRYECVQAGAVRLGSGHSHGACASTFENLVFDQACASEACTLERTKNIVDARITGPRLIVRHCPAIRRLDAIYCWRSERIPRSAQMRPAAQVIGAGLKPTLGLAERTRPRRPFWQNEPKRADVWLSLAEPTQACPAWQNEPKRDAPALAERTRDARLGHYLQSCICTIF